MVTRDMKTPTLAKESGVPYGTLRKMLELNSVADHEQLRRIADYRQENSLDAPTAAYADDASAAFADTRAYGDAPDMSDWSTSEQAAYIAAHLEQFDVAAKHGDGEHEQIEYEDLP